MTEQENLTTVNINPVLEESWKQAMKEEFIKPYFIESPGFKHCLRINVRKAYLWLRKFLLLR